MTTLPHDDVMPTAVEDAVARLDAGAPPPPSHAPERRLTSVVAPDAGATDGVGAPRPDPRPRLRLVPALPPARTTPASGPVVPPLLRERGRRVGSDHDVRTSEPDDERGAAPVTDAGRFAHGVGLACVEVVLGRRPPGQLARWVAPEVLESLQETAALIRRAGVLTHARRPAARRVRVCPVDRHTAEACLVVDDGVRVRAVALRLEAHRGAWRVTTLEIG
ncbi:Rv3235 family protein [Cellulomonas dongxiuzhuiae]|uniref:Rv3235 family protein n=1 Tax=Cellulomonas dongxiuzhuiae TaxID=2819979 RepID=UPI001AAE9F23|nr:Rv3235 family protein [Cellulomonas dongxiuzhuiae]MBO3086740.1 energy transducer TonB [Cellulomonas dongxiuzhuiae]